MSGCPGPATFSRSLESQPAPVLKSMRCSAQMPRDAAAGGPYQSSGGVADGTRTEAPGEAGVVEGHSYLGRAPRHVPGFPEFIPGFIPRLQQGNAPRPHPENLRCPGADRSAQPPFEICHQELRLRSLKYRPSQTDCRCCRGRDRAIGTSIVQAVEVLRRQRLQVRQSLRTERQPSSSSLLLAPSPRLWAR